MRRTVVLAVLAVAAATLLACHTITEDLPSRPSPIQVVKLNAHVYFIECNGAPVPGTGGAKKAPVGCRIHFDCTGRDASNAPTVPRGIPRWTYSDPGLVSGGNTGFNPVVIAKNTGCMSFYAEVDGVTSNTSEICIE
jgi:hypothetical protein